LALASLIRELGVDQAAEVLERHRTLDADAVDEECRCPIDVETFARIEIVLHVRGIGPASEALIELGNIEVGGGRELRQIVVTALELIAEKQVVVFPEFPLRQGTPGCLGGVHSVRVKPQREIAVRELDLAGILGYQLLQCRLGGGAVWALEVGKLHDGDRRVCRSTHALRICSDRRARWIEKDGDLRARFQPTDNFGIVTSLEYRLHPVGPVFGGAVFHPAAKAKELLRFWREYAESIPDELVVQGGSFTLPDGVAVFGIAGCYCGPVSEGEKVLRPLRVFGSPMADAFGAMSYLQIQGMFESFFPPGRLVYTKSNFIRSMDDQTVDALVSWVGKSPSRYTFAPFIEHWHGAATRVAPTATAFPHRQYSWNLLAWSMWESPADSEKNIQWNRDCCEALRPFLIPSAYSNYVTDEGEATTREAYGPNYERLVALKKKYDPTNFFRMNHNIMPR